MYNGFILRGMGALGSNTLPSIGDPMGRGYFYPTLSMYGGTNTIVSNAKIDVHIYKNV